MANNLWLANRQRHPNPEMKIFLFHHAGGSTAFFSGWDRLFPKAWELCLVQLPGRWERPAEKIETDMTKLIQQLDEGLQSELDRPFAVLGVSLGAIVGFEWVRALKPDIQKKAIHFFAVSRGSPTSAHLTPLLSQIENDQDFVSEIQRRYGELPKILFSDEGLKKTFINFLRCDMRLLEDYTFRPGPKIHTPITSILGDADWTINLENLDEWQEQTTSSWESKQFSGGHFFISEFRDEVLNYLVQRLKDTPHS